MKQRFLRKLFGLALTLAFALSLTACTPQIIINTGGNPQTENSSETSNTASEPVVANSEQQETNESKKQSNSSKEDKTSTPKKSSPSKNTVKTNTQKSDFITEAKAKSIALKHAEVKSKEISYYRIHLDTDDGVSKYEISFYVDKKEYEYDINAKTGKILSYEKPKPTLSDAKISKSKAKSIALKDAGVKAADIFDYELETDVDKNVVKYEISFKANGFEYDYEINAKGGNIIKKEKEKDD